MTTPNRPLLSPAAQAVLDAYNREARPEPHHQREAIAAALRAVADQVVPRESTKDPLWASSAYKQRADTRAYLLAIAAELDGDMKAAEADPIAKATSSPETCNRRLDKFMSVTNDQLEVLAEIFSETDRADKISLHCDPVTKTVTVRYEDLDDGWFNDLCNLRSSLNS